MTATAYTQLEKHFSRYFVLKGASAMMHWDSSTMMPSGSSEVRAEQLATLAEMAHDIITAPQLKELLGESESLALNDWQKANIREMRRMWVHENALDGKLVSAFTLACAKSEAFWREARSRNDFAGFTPYLEHVIALVREIAKAKSSVLGSSPYDALLDSYDPGMRSADIDVWFTDLESFLPPLVQEVMAHQARKPKMLPLNGPFPAAAQKQLGLQFMEKLGFDFTRGRLDESRHPFCGGVPGDVRLTTRYSEDNFTDGFFGVLHETGHALYELSLPAEWRNQPVGEARGMSMHESQSLFIEMQIARGLPFLTYAAPIVREALGRSGPEWEADNLYRLVSRVEPSLIRVGADEVTYPLHILLRYRLEKVLLSGDLQVKDLPAAWNDGMQHFLGLTPLNDSDGCMQDIHWPDGAFGYFPTYTIGAMIAAQLFTALKQAIPDIETQIKSGNFHIIKEWLNKHIHSQGSHLSTMELVRQATGKTLDVEIYKSHLKNRYLA